MKKVLLVLGISFVSLNSYAFEQVIGLSGGYTNQTSKTTHYQKTEFDNPNYNPNRPESTSNQKRIQNQWIDKSKHNNSGYNLNLEYQVRFDFPLANTTNFWVLGIGYTYDNVRTNPKYQSLDSFTSTNHNPYVLAMLTLFKNKDVAVRWGWAFGNGFNKENSHKYNKITADMLLDAEYNVSNSFILFSRASINMVRGKNDVYDTNLGVSKEDEFYQNETVLSNNIKMKSKDYAYRINLGIRYKI